MKFKIIKPSIEDLKNESKNWRWHSENKECKLCHSNFNYGNKSKLFCGLCKLSVKCDCCSEWFEYEFSVSGRGYYIDLEKEFPVI